MQIFGAQGELGIRIEDHQVRVASRGDGSFALLQAGKFRRLRRHPARQVLEGKTTLAHLCPNYGDRHAEAGDSSPRLAEISLLHGWRARGVIGRDQIDHSIAKPLPQRFPVGSRADGRRALEERAAGGNLFGDEVQVVRTGLHRNRAGPRRAPGADPRAPARWTNERCAAETEYLRQSPISMRMAANSASSGRERS